LSGLMHLGLTTGPLCPSFCTRLQKPHSLSKVNLSTLLVLSSDKLEYTVKTYYIITAVYSESYIKHTKTLFSRTRSTLYVISGCTYCFLFLSQTHRHTYAYTPTLTHMLAHTHTHTRAHAYEHTYIYYVVTTGLSTVHTSHKY
jgi:hypothetical protein